MLLFSGLTLDDLGRIRYCRLWLVLAFILLHAGNFSCSIAVGRCIKSPFYTEIAQHSHTTPPCNFKLQACIPQLKAAWRVTQQHRGSSVTFLQAWQAPLYTSTHWRDKAMTIIYHPCYVGDDLVFRISSSRASRTKFVHIFFFLLPIWVSC